ncbi:hypothetical protein LUD75_19000 [Epilithonimonas sp. JDS]|nr:hypothetical protein [Epilithonimonas sp. JDS]
MIEKETPADPASFPQGKYRMMPKWKSNIQSMGCETRMSKYLDKRFSMRKK